MENEEELLAVDEVSPPKDVHFSGAGVLGLMFGATAIGFAPIFVRLSEVGPTSTAFWRVFLAQPFLWGVLSLHHRIRPESPRPAARSDYAWLFLAGSIFCFNSSIWHWSIRYTSVANATLFSNLAPLVVTLTGYLVFRERVTRLFLLGLGLTLFGAFLIVGDSLSIGWGQIYGDLLATLTAVFYALYLMTVNHVRGRFSAPTVMAYSGIASCFWLMGLSVLTESDVVPQTLSGWLSVFGLAAISHTMGQGMIAYGLGHLPTSLSSVVLLLQPVVAGIAAWWILHEKMGALQILGGLVVLAGIYVSKRGSVKKA